MEIKKWVTWKGRRLPIGQDGKIIKLNQDQVNVLKNRKSFVDYGVDDVLATKTELKYANSKYRRINDIKKSYQKRKEVLPETDLFAGCRRAGIGDRHC